ncbi:MAG: cytochrome P450, partial [Acidimicrobiia bacterium]
MTVTREQMPPAVSGRRPGVGHTVDFLRNPVGLLERGLAEHGRVFSLRLGNRDAVVLLGPEHHEFFFSATDKLLSIRTAYPFFVEMFGERFWYFAGPDEWRRQRALVVPRFQGRQLEAYVEAMAAETEALMAKLGPVGIFDLVPTLGPLVMRIAGRAFLGEEFSARLGEGFFTEFRRFSGGMEPVLPLWLPLPRLLRSKQARAGLHRTLGALIAERRRRPLDPPDFLQTLAGSRYADGAPVPDEVIVNLILLLTWAGHETTAGHISWAVADLLGHPDFLAGLQAQQDDVVGG